MESCSRLAGRRRTTWRYGESRVPNTSNLSFQGVDGESIDFPAPLNFEIRPKALHVLVPKGTTPGYISRAETRTAAILDLARLGGDPEESDN